MCFLSRAVMLLLFLLASFCCVDFLDFDIGVKYGDRYKIVLTSKVETVEVRYRNKLAPVVLWSNTNPLLPQSRSRKRIGIYYILYNLTQDDNGQYITKDKTGLEMEVYNIHVKENTKYYKRKSGGTIWMSFTLDPQSCNVYFFPESKMSMIKMVSSGRLTGDVPSSGCSYMELEQPCAIANTYIQSTCKGQFEFRDQNDNNALVVTLDVEPEELDLSPVGITLGVLSIVTGCCGCLKYCCCGSSSSQNEEEEEESPENEPAVQYNKYDGEPVRIKLEDSAPDAYGSTQPSSNETGPLMQTPSSVAIKSSEYDGEPVRIKLEDSAPDAYGSTQPSSNETGPLMQTPSSVAIKSSEGDGSDRRAIRGPSSIISEPHFVLKGMTFPSALSSGSTSHEVYTSDKLNFG